MTTTVVWKGASSTFHKPAAAWNRTRCGAFEITSQEVQEGLIEIEKREAAEQRGKRQCEKCFREIEFKRP